MMERQVEVYIYLLLPKMSILGLIVEICAFLCHSPAYCFISDGAWPLRVKVV